MNNENKEKVNKKGIFKSLQFKMVALLASLGITVAGGALLLGDKDYIENEENNKPEISTDIDKESTEESFTDRMKVGIIEELTHEFKEKTTFESIDRVLLQIVLQYNKEYGTDLTPDDLSLIESQPRFLGVRSDGTYVQDYKNMTLVEYSIKDGEDYYTYRDKIYVIINNRTNEIIGTVGKIKSEIVDIDTKIVKNEKNKEFQEAENKINLIEGKTNEEKEKIYKALEAKSLGKDKFEEEIDSRE